VPVSLPAHVRKAVWACAAFAFGHLSFAFLLLAGSANGWSDQRTLLSYALYFAVYTLASPLAGRASDRLGRRPLLIAGYAGYALTALGLACTSDSPWLLAVFVGYGLSEAITDAVQRAWISDLAPREQRAAALGAYHAAIAVVALPGGVLIGSLWGHWGIVGASSLSLAITAAAAIALWRIPSSARPAIS
jgi:MFS family permease